MAGAPLPCPICGEDRAEAYRPFCSKRCADVDLNRWLKGRYAVPVVEEDGAEGEHLPDDDSR
ncbi:MAG: DNA gyrase inhibitor YacG [Pseudomonadota bacterium]